MRNVIIKKSLQAFYVSLFFLLSIPALCNAAAQPKIITDSAEFNQSAGTVTINGTFELTDLLVKLDGTNLICPTITPTQIICTLIDSSINTKSSRLEVFAGLQDNKVVTTQGNERPVQFKSLLDVTHVSSSNDVYGTINVRRYGAKGDGTTDDTATIQSALNAVPTGGTLLFPLGNYLITDEFIINKRINIEGVGYGSQIYQSNLSKNIFHLQNLHAVTVSDLYLGSSATTVGASLIKMTNTHRSRIENIIMLGGYYGIHLEGSLLNEFVGIKTGTNFQGFFGGNNLQFINQAWVYAERLNTISSNANTFIAPTLEGGNNGIRLNDGAAQGSIYIYGGAIEGIAGVGLSFNNTFLPSVISGVHFEGNGVADIIVDNSHNIRIESVLANNIVQVTNNSADVVMTSSVINSIDIGADVRRTRMESVRYNLSGTDVITDNSHDTTYVNVANNASGHVDFWSTMGMWTKNPNANDVGLTPNRVLEINGDVKAAAFSTGDISFRYEGKVVWRMFEDDKGLYLENAANKEVSRIFLDSDIKPIKNLMAEQGNVMKQLRKEVNALNTQIKELQGSAVD